MNTTEKIIKCFNNKLNNYQQPVTVLSKTDENEFIVDETVMFDWDEISKFYSDGDESSSVDAIYCYIENHELTIYLFEFKNHDLHDPFFDTKKQLKNIADNMEESEYCCDYAKEIKRIRKKLVSKKIISLKTKPIESLILLHKILKENGISPEEIITIRKEYYIVSKTPVSGNKSNWHRSSRNREIFGFIDKIKPFPFAEIEHLSEKSYFSFINSLKMKNKLNV